MSALQTTFNKVAEHLARQKIAAIDKSGGCQLRGPDNTKCAVGFFIPDDVYTKAMEEDSVISNTRMDQYRNAPAERLALVRSYYPMHAVLDDFLDPSPEQLNLLQALQEVHDTAAERDRAPPYNDVARPMQGNRQWATRLADVAVQYGLDFHVTQFKTDLANPFFCYPHNEPKQ